jgi:hypothetical protein
MRSIRGCGACAAALVAISSMGAYAGEARAAGAEPQFTLAPDRGIVTGFAGFGGQLNQNLYADINGPPADPASVETEVLALRPQFVRIFFNTSAWTFADRMASFVRTVQLAQRAGSVIDITWQGSTYAYAKANLPRFAQVLADLLDNRGIGGLWVTLFNEPNSTNLTLAQYEELYRLLDAALTSEGVRARVHFMGGDLVGTTSPLGQSQTDWFTYMASHMGDLLDGWSVHVYWGFWEPEKIERRLATEVRTIFAAIPAEQRRPLFVTEFGVRGNPTIAGLSNFQPGFWLDGTPMTQTTLAAFQDGWFMIRAAQLGFSGLAMWDLDNAKYDNGTQDFSAIGPERDGWLTRPIYHLLQLFTYTTEPTGGSIVDVVPGPSAGESQRLTAYLPPGGGVTILGLDTRAQEMATVSNVPIAYSVGGLPANRQFRLVVWNGNGGGTDVDFGVLSSGDAGAVSFSVPLNGIFALTSVPLGTLPS